MDNFYPPVSTTARQQQQATAAASATTSSAAASATAAVSAAAMGAKSVTMPLNAASSPPHVHVQQHHQSQGYMVDNDFPTPPAFTQEQEVAELATVTIEEMTKVEKDVQGITTAFYGMGLSRSSSSKKKNSVSTSFTSSIDDVCRVRQHDLDALENELSMLPLYKTTAYMQACIKCPQLLTPDFKAAFLEYDELDARRAALRLATYWNMRYDTFGPNRCFLPMTLSGAMQDEVADMKKYCPYQVLPETDGSGRAIIYLDSSRRDLSKFPGEREARAYLYIWHSLAADPAIRRAGFVVVVNNRNFDMKKLCFKSTSFLSDLVNKAIPIKFRCLHCCYSNPLMHYVIFPMLKHVWGRAARLRVRLHNGSEAQVLDRLKGYQLTQDLLPKDIGGDLDLRCNFDQWIANQSIKEIYADMQAAQAQHEKDKAETALSSLRPSAKRQRSDDEAKVSSINTSQNDSMKVSSSSTSHGRISQSLALEHSQNLFTRADKAQEIAEEARTRAITTLNAELLKGSGGSSFSEQEDNTSSPLDAAALKSKAEMMPACTTYESVEAAHSAAAPSTNNTATVNSSSMTESFVGEAGAEQFAGGNTSGDLDEEDIAILLQACDEDIVRDGKIFSSSVSGNSNIFEDI